jgi:hypothetical protein
MWDAMTWGRNFAFCNDHFLFNIIYMGKYKTWTPGPWTPCLDRVHGPPLWTGSMDPLHGPGPWTPSMGRIFPNFNITVKHDSSFQFKKIF